MGGVEYSASLMSHEQSAINSSSSSAKRQVDRPRTLAFHFFLFNFTFFAVSVLLLCSASVLLLLHSFIAVNRSIGQIATTPVDGGEPEDGPRPGVGGGG